MDQPQFATVTFVSEQDSSLSSTFRVPISRETSVRHLAKDAMQRLVMSRFSSATGSRDFPSISVAEVRVGGLEPQNAEIFARDLVTQVVLVKEEVVFMRLQVSPRGDDDTAHKGRGSGSGSSSAHTDGATVVLQASKPDPCAGVSATTTRAPSPACAPTEPGAIPCRPALAEKPVNAPAPSVAPAAGKASATATTTRSPHLHHQATKRSRADEPSAVAAKAPQGRAAPRREETRATETRSRPFGWGPEASNFFPDNYCSSPDKLARRTRAAASRQPPRSTQAGRKCRETKEVLVATTTETRASGKESANRPAGWGPEAYKSFPSNYVASPDRLAREIRKQRREEAKRKKAGGEGAPTAPTTAGVMAKRESIARQLEYEEEDARRRTVGHHVDSAVVVEDEPQEGEATEEAKATAPLPKGWGTEATKYFDPNTYCDDPRKAKVNLSDCPRSVRPHRTPPSALFH